MAKPAPTSTPTALLPPLSPIETLLFSDNNAVSGREVPRA
jgi:hypothetical protein